jgi:hypothetical protein
VIFRGDLNIVHISVCDFTRLQSVRISIVHITIILTPECKLIVIMNNDKMPGTQFRQNVTANGFNRCQNAILLTCESDSKATIEQISNCHTLKYHIESRSAQSNGEYRRISYMGFRMVQPRKMKREMKFARNTQDFAKKWL